MTEKELDIDVEMYNPVNARKRYEEAGYPPSQVESLLIIAAMIYARPADEVRIAVAERRERGLPTF